MTNRRVRLLLGFLTALLAAPALADVGPAGDEFRVNTYTTGGQFNPALCRTAGGDFVVVWESSGIDG